MPNCVVTTATEPLTAIEANHPPLEVDVRRIASLDFVSNFDATRHDSVKPITSFCMLRFSLGVGDFLHDRQRR